MPVPVLAHDHPHLLAVVEVLYILSGKQFPNPLYGVVAAYKLHAYTCNKERPPPPSRSDSLRESSY